MTPVGRIVRARDFQAVLATVARARSEHFALHHVAVLPAPLTAPQTAKQQNLSTDGDRPAAGSVDDLLDACPRLGLVVPKRHARRAVTRTMIKRQMRAAMQRHAVGLAGWWVVRLRVGFPVAQFPSAASAPLRRLASSELDALFTSGRRRMGLDPVAVPGMASAGQVAA